MSRTYFILSALFAAIGVALGAFGAHYLKNKLSIELLSVYQTAVNYQLYHSLAMGFTVLTYQHYKSKYLKASAFSFCIGILLFSGSLYTLCITGFKQLGMVTPLGGLAFLIGWVLFIIGICKKKLL